MPDSKPDGDTPMTDVLAAQILNDHAHGLHESYALPDTCSYPRCAEAYWHVARTQEAQPPFSQ